MLYGSLDDGIAALHLTDDGVVLVAQFVIIAGMRQQRKPTSATSIAMIP